MGREHLPSICSSVAGVGAAFAALLCALALTLAGGCSVRTGSKLLVPASGGDEGAWASPIARHHPLVGTIHDVARGRTIAPVELNDALVAADFVLLGEQHDNVDHHELQAYLLKELAMAGRRPAVAFEQLDLDRQQAVDASLTARATAPTRERASALAEAVNWKDSGWPPFDQYRPLFETAIGAGLEIRAANLSRAQVRRSNGPEAGAASGPAAKSEPVLSTEARASLAADIKESHCGYADARMVEAMIEAQRRRDQTMAGVAVDALGSPLSKSVVLVAGFGHARSDFGVPVYLHRRAPGRRVVSVAFLEVLPDLTTPAAYARPLHAERLPFDYVIFTPRADDEDPCEKFRESLEKMKAR